MTDYLAAYAAQLDATPSWPECRCVEADDGAADTFDCPLHAETPEGRQWNRDHPDGITAEEQESMDRRDAYAVGPLVTTTHHHQQRLGGGEGR